MTYKENIKAILECSFAGFKEEIIDSACNRILEQELCEDEYIKVPKKALKYRTAGMIAYNAEWLKNHFDIERAVICGAQQPSDDAISRQAVLDIVDSYSESQSNVEDVTQDIISDIVALPLVNPQPKTGHWLRTGEVDVFYDLPSYECSKCGQTSLENGDYCPNCGAKMFESQERSGKE